MCLLEHIQVTKYAGGVKKGFAVVSGILLSTWLQVSLYSCIFMSSMRVVAVVLGVVYLCVRMIFFFRVCVCMYVCMCACVCVCLCVCVYGYTCFRATFTHTRIYIYIYIYIYYVCTCFRRDARAMIHP